jgi:hypothetical protein
MDWLAEIVLCTEGLVFLGLFALLIILALRRIRIKKEETFENRDN